ncbi:MULTISPECIES: ABC transporter permease [Methanobacterium]|uniref:ABC transporter permease n=1 Tax=Methanobacterium veterum TaxID=408577 RepID=A0A9E5DJA7_9EURY|nr:MULTISPECIES: ABC transporter permease [Methanobacterium]MCZ3365770.1 ABC transporter permease [Methanobacterium veterum]MCZ3371234.1 ABC transporter permease [Methanobacterium veterum]
MVETKKIMWMFKKDLLVLWRHPPRLISILLFPIIMITLFGYGMGGTLENIPVVVVEQSHGQVTDATLNAIKGMSLYDVKDIITDPDKGKEMVQNGQVKAAIILPANYDDMSSTQPKSVVVDVDSSDQMASSAVIPATQALFNQISNKMGVQKLEGMNLTPSSAIQVQSNQVAAASQGINFQNVMDSINLQINKMYGDVKYIDFLVPAVIGMTVLFGCMFGMGDALAGERERGELARLFMTPTSIATVVGGKIISKLSIEIVRALILIAAAIVLFGIVIKGSMILTLLVLILGALCFVGFGVMISARVSTQEDYMQMVMPITMPMMFVSGVFYPIETMPWIFQKLAYIFPLTYVNDALRAVMLKGVGIGAIWVDIAVLLGFTGLFFALGVTKFNRDI